MPVTLEDVYRARERIAPHIRATPVLELNHRRNPLTKARLTLKLDNHQVTGSFKVRGALSKALSLKESERKHGLITASGGNHGMAVAYAGRLLGIPATIYLSKNVPKTRAERLQAWGAKVVYEGDVWDDANQAAQEAGESQGYSYIHPFGDEAVIAGQGTVALEMIEQIKDFDHCLIAVGGGGLIAGVGVVLGALVPSCRLIGIEPVGAAAIYGALNAGHPIKIPSVTTKAVSLAPSETTALNLEIIQKYVDQVVLAEDTQMIAGARWLWEEAGIAAEMAGAASLAAIQSGLVKLPDHAHAALLVCGAGTDGFADH